MLPEVLMLEKALIRLSALETTVLLQVLCSFCYNEIKIQNNLSGGKRISFQYCLLLIYKDGQQ